MEIHKKLWLKEIHQKRDVSKSNVQTEFEEHTRDMYASKDGGQSNLVAEENNLVMKVA